MFYFIRFIYINWFNIVNPTRLIPSIQLLYRIMQLDMMKPNQHPNQPSSNQNLEQPNPSQGPRNPNDEIDASLVMLRSLIRYLQSTRDPS